MKIKLGLIFIIFSFTACVMNEPKTRSNLIKLSKQGKYFTKSEQHTINKSLDQIVNRLVKQSKKCLNKTVVYRYQSSKIEAYRRGYTFGFERPSKTRLEFTIFLNDNPIIAVNYTQIKRKKVKMALYTPRNVKRLYRSVIEWSKGTSTACPELK